MRITDYFTHNLWFGSSGANQTTVFKPNFSKKGKLSSFG